MYKTNVYTHSYIHTRIHKKLYTNKGCADVLTQKNIGIPIRNIPNVRLFKFYSIGSFYSAYIEFCTE